MRCRTPEELRAYDQGRLDERERIFKALEGLTMTVPVTLEYEGIDALKQMVTFDFPVGKLRRTLGI